MKRILLVLGAVVLVASLASYLYLHSGAAITGRADVPKILAAAQAYRKALEAERTLVPAFANVQDLVRLGFLRPADIRGFAGMEVTVSLATQLNGPTDVLMRARLPDGTEMVALADGSVQQVKR